VTISTKFEVDMTISVLCGRLLSGCFDLYQRSLSEEVVQLFFQLQCDTVDTSPDFGGQNVLNTFEIFETADGRLKRT